MKTGRLFVEWLLIGMVASLAVLWAANVSLLERRVVYDLVSPAYAPPPDDRILFVTIDDETLAALGRWPWTRDRHAQALDALNRAHPRAILYDVLFLEPSPQDAALAASMRRGAPVFLPMLFDVPGPDGAPWLIRRPTPRIAAAAAGLGTANLLIDGDGRARSVAVATPDGTTILPHMAELAYRAETGHPSPAFERTRADGAPLYLAFRASGAFRTVSLLSVIRGEVPDAFVRDKIVIVGAAAEGLGDVHPIPSGVGSRMPGAEIQANLLSSLLADRFVRFVPRWVEIALSLALVWGLLAAFWRLPPSRSLLIAMGATALTVGATSAALAFAGLWFPPLPALLGIAIVYPLWGWRRLAAVAQFMEQEIDRLLAQMRRDSPPAPRRTGGDRVAEDASRLHQVIDYMQRSAVEREQTLQFLSHDMRAPQAAIIALLDRDRTPAAPAAADAGAGPSLHDRIRRYAESTLRLADDFVQLARLERQNSLHEPVDVNDALAQAADMVWARAQARKVRIDRRPETDFDLWAEGDPAALVRAFTNLLSNAVAVAPPGSAVRCGVERDGTGARAWVEDDGPGLPPERRADPFARFGYSGGKDGESGSGLGLAYVAAVARAYGGKALYEDAPGGGARFLLWLPLCDDDMPADEDLSAA